MEILKKDRQQDSGLFGKCKEWEFMEKNYDVCWVCFPQRDGLDPLHGELAQARQRFFTGGRRTIRVENKHAVKGFSGQVKGRISQRGMYWKKTAKGASGGDVVLEEAFGRKDGWLVVVRDFRGVIVSRSFFDKSHRWVKSEYYEPWDSAAARVTFVPGEQGAIVRQDRESGKDACRETPLYPAPYQSGTAGQNLVDTRLGPPQLLMLTTKGELCFTPQAQAEQRQTALEEVSGGTVVLLPAWEVREGALLEEDEEGSAITFTSLEEYARIEPPAPKEETSVEPIDPMIPEEDSGEFTPIEDAEEKDAELEEASQPEEAELPPQNESDEENIPQPEEDNAPDPGDCDGEEESAPLPEADSIEAILAETAAGEIPPGHTEDIRNGTLTGRGRTQQPGGMTSYEGEYSDGKRHGFGAYYYKDGNLCYAGSWKDDRRDGLGVSFRDSDHALHIANWQEGQPHGLATVFDKDGSLRYSGRIENGKKEGAGVMINGRDGTVFVGQWSAGEATGLGSAFDAQGRLLYYGGWKDGKHHGHGTEFDQNGSVVFDGEFRDGKYYNGVLYQKLKAEQAE